MKLVEQLAEKTAVTLISQKMWRKKIRFAYKDGYPKRDVERLCSSYAKWRKTEKTKCIKLDDLSIDSEKNVFFSHYQANSFSGMISFLTGGKNGPQALRMIAARIFSNIQNRTIFGRCKIQPLSISTRIQIVE